MSDDLRIHPLLGCHPDSEEATPIRMGGVTGRVGHYGPTRVDAYGNPKIHKGVDLLCVEGWPVRAAHSGTVRVAGWENPAEPTQGYGQRVTLLGGDGHLETRYAHLSEVRVAAGQEVAAGEILGLSGRTGNVGPDAATHLHFEVRSFGAPIDPLPWLVA